VKFKALKIKKNKNELCSAAAPVVYPLFNPSIWFCSNKSIDRIKIYILK